MLANPIAIDSVSSLGSGQYSFSAFVQDGNKAKYYNIGDYVKDTNNNEFEILTLSVSPFTSGSSVTVQFVTSDVLPQQDTGFDSIAFTPDQVDVRPFIITAVFVTGVAFFSAPDYEYTVQITGADIIEANKMTIGDSFVDLSGKEYSLSFIDGVSRFAVPFRVIEVVKEGVEPSTGDGAFYRSTSNVKLFQGTEIIDPARTVVRNRDNFYVDTKITELENTLASITGTSTIQVLNPTGSTIVQGTPIGINVSGEMQLLDVAIEDNILSFVGLTKTDISSGSTGEVVVSGPAENVNTTANLDEIVYVAKTGGLTSTKPEIGVGGFVAGDIIVKVGKVTKNATNGSLKDVVVQPQIIGQI